VSAIGQRARIARVRRLQHGLAARAAAEASGQLRMLETSDRRLGQMRQGLAAEPGATTGAAMAARGELAMRLEAARTGLGRTIDGARAASELRERARIGARRDQESAEKLEKRAAAAALRRAEEKGAAGFRFRRRDKGEEW
jgi:hypothetical protein